MFLRRLLTLISLVGAFAATAVVAAEPASAHYTDSSHRHGWTSLASMGGQLLNCWSGYGLYSNSVSVPPPDLITSPTPWTGTAQKVAFRAQLEYYDFSHGAWMDKAWTGSKWGNLPSSVWYYALATTTGMYISWRELDTNRWASNNVSFNVNAGFYYRVHFYYYWYYDNVKHDEVTNYCYSS
jgi:hypothetical protein